MSMGRRQFVAEFKTTAELDAVREKRPLAELASQYGVHPSQTTAWKKELKESTVEVFAGKRELPTDESVEKAKMPLYEHTGRSGGQGTALPPAGTAARGRAGRSRKGAAGYTHGLAAGR